MSKTQHVCRITLHSEKGVETHFLDSETFVVGRSPEADVTCLYPQASRRHLSITIKGGHQIWIEDLGSANGTFVSGKPILAKTPYQYRPGDPIHLGSTDEYIIVDLYESPHIAREEAKRLLADAQARAQTMVKEQQDKAAAIMKAAEATAETLQKEAESAVGLARKSAEQMAVEIKKQAENEAARKRAEVESDIRELIARGNEEIEAMRAKADMEYQARMQRGDEELQERRAEDEKWLRSKRASDEAELELLRTTILEDRQKMLEVNRAVCEEALNEARQKALEIVRKQQVESQQALEKAESQGRESATQMRMMAEAEATDLIDRARAQAALTVQEATTRAQQLVQVAEVEARTRTENAESKANAVTQEAEAQARMRTEEAESRARTVTQEADAYAAHLRNESETQAQRLGKESKEKAETALREAQAKAWTIVSQATQEAERLTREATEHHKKLKAEADGMKDEAIRLRDRAQSENAELLKRQEQLRALTAGLEEANRAVEQKNKDLVQESLDYQKARQVALDESEAARAESKRLQDQLRKEIEVVKEELAQEKGHLRDTLMRLDNSVREMEVARADRKEAEERAQKAREGASAWLKEVEDRHKILTAEVSGLSAEKAELEATAADMRNDILAERKRLYDEVAAELEGQRTQAKLDVRQLMDRAERESQSLIEQARLIRTKAEEQSASLKEEVERQIAEIRAKSDEDFQARKRQEEQQIATMRLREMEESKARILEEESLIKSRRKEYLNHISRGLEAFILPRLQEILGAKATPDVLDPFRKELLNTVRQVVNEEVSAEQETLRQMMDFDPEAEKRRKKVRLRVAGAVAVVVLLVTILAALPELRTKIFYSVVGNPIERKSASDIYATKFKEERANKPKFNPKQTLEMKASFTDNVLYTTGYVDLKLNKDIQEKWILELNDFIVDDLKLDEETIVRYIAIEANLVARLAELRAGINPQFEKEGIARLREAEKAAIKEILDLLGSEMVFERLRDFEKAYFSTLDRTN